MPHTKIKGDTVIAMIIAQAHQMLEHRKHNGLQTISANGISGPNSARRSTSTANPALPAWLLRPTIENPWACFTACPSLSNGHNYMWVVLCQLMSMVHLIPVEITIRASQLTGLYVQEIVQLHRLPDTIVSDRDTKFTSIFWQEVHQMLGAKLLMSTAFHPQTDRASGCAICTTTQILHAMVQPNQCDWVEMVPMVEYALNLSISSSMGFAPFKLNYGHICKLAQICYLAAISHSCHKLATCL